MKIHKSYIALGLMIAFVVLFEVAAHADDSNERTKITFSAPIQVPGHVLAAGTYVFQQAEPNGNLNVIEIFNADGNALVATVQTVSTDRAEPTDHTAITLAAPEAGQPDVLVKWFYPGRTTGHEFVYSQRQEQELAGARHETFVGGRLMPGAEAAGE